MARSRFQPFLAHLIQGQAIYQGLFAESPNAYVVLTPDLKIINANDAYLTFAPKTRDELVGRYLFDAFPDSPANDGARNLLESFHRVRASQHRDIMPLQRYDVQDRNGIWEVRYWYPTNWAIVDDGGSITAVIHQVSEASEPEQLSRLLAATRAELAKATNSREELDRMLNQVKPHRRRRSVRQPS
jgi:PAS domain-containing protein